MIEPDLIEFPSHTILRNTQRLWGINYHEQKGGAVKDSGFVMGKRHGGRRTERFPGFCQKQKSKVDEDKMEL